jgi:hypothetical protein
MAALSRHSRSRALAATVLLGIATTTSACCAYEAQLWSSESSSRAWE